jgi:hypothetical protein
VSCQEFVELVTPYSERTLRPDRREAFEEHLLVCPPCRVYTTQLEQTLRILARLRSAGDDAPDDDELQEPPPSPATDGASTERERALKFLEPERLAPFSRTRWPDPHSSDPWVSAGDAAMCLAGVHACTIEAAPFWLNDELWIVELEGVSERTERKVVAHRGRLVERVEAWNEGARQRFGAACVGIARSAAVEILAERQPRDAQALAERALDAGLAEDAAQRAGDVGVDSRARAAWNYLAVALESAKAPAGVAFVAAVAVEHSRGPGGAAGERARQSAWLSEELALAGLLAVPSETRG